MLGADTLLNVSGKLAGVNRDNVGNTDAAGQLVDSAGEQGPPIASCLHDPPPDHPDRAWGALEPRISP